MSDSRQKSASARSFVRMEEEMEASDADFTSVPIAEFFSPRTVAFDIFVRLGEGRYLRIFRVGEDFDESELKIYRQDRGMRYVYFDRKFRGMYVRSSSALLQKMADLPTVPIRTKFGVARILCELYVQEMLECREDARADLVEKGKELIAILSAWVDTQKGLDEAFWNLESVDGTLPSLNFHTGILAVLFSHRMPWTSRRTTETLLFAALLCDIGLGLLPPELRRIKTRRMNPQQLRQYESHPDLSATLLEHTKSKSISENLLLIVRQHHEFCDGSGFPQKLTGEKTLMLSKLVVLCAEIVRTSSELILSPIDAVKNMFPEFSEKIFEEKPELVARFDRALLIQLFKWLNERREGG